MVRRRQRHRARTVYPRSKILVFAFILCATWLLYWGLTSRKLARGVPDTAPVISRGELTPVRPAAVGRPPRPIYPHSVIRGGAYSLAELDAARYADPVVAAHYAIFNRAQMRIERAPGPAAVYVSYRQGDRIYWTRRKVVLAADEALLTDGVHFARARCGNRISRTLPGSALTGEPDADLDIPEAPSTAHPGDAQAVPPDVFSLPQVVHEVFPSLLGSWLSGAGGPGGIAGSAAGGAGDPGGTAFPVSRGESAPPGFRFPILPEFTASPSIPTIWPIDFTTLLLPPAGAGLWWVLPVPPPGNFGTGGATGPTAGGTTLPPPAVTGLPPLPGITAPPGTATTPASTIFTELHGSPPAPSSSSGTALTSTDGSTPQTETVLPATDSVPPAINVPEPAPAILLLCGAVIAALRRRSGRRSN